MFIQGTQANEQALSFESNYTFKSIENQDIMLLQMLEKQLDTLSIDHLEAALQQTLAQFNQILGNYDEKIMIDGQIHTLKQLVQLQAKIQVEQQLDVSQLNMLYLSIYRLDQQIQKARFVPLLKEILGEKFEKVTIGDVNKALSFADGQTALEVLAGTQAKFRYSLPQNVLINFTRQSLMNGVQSVEELEAYIVQQVNDVEALMKKLQHTVHSNERMIILNALPFPRFQEASKEIQQEVIERLSRAGEDVMENFSALQRFITLETLRANKAFAEQQLVNQEKTVTQKLIEQAWNIVDQKTATTLSVS